jgi:lysophospholipase L1-like esterase
MGRFFILSLLLTTIISSEILWAENPHPSGNTIAVNSPAFVFSPGNWTGDQGRSGSVFRQSWYPGAYFRVTWSTTNENPSADILLDTSPGQDLKNKPSITYNVDGLWTDNVSCATNDIKVNGLKGAGKHTLSVYFKTSEQSNRWGSPDASGKNVLRVTGLQVDAEARPEIANHGTHWALIVGDSITEGSAADFGKSDNLSDWSFLVGQGLQERDYEYGVSACGWSGWIRPGDNPPGDVPSYYMISDSHEGVGGSYDDTKSRWNKIDGGTSHSLLDTSNHISAYGDTRQEPSLILINYGTNDDLSHASASDIQASINQSLTALRASAPHASIYLIVPFGQYALKPLQDGLAAYQAAAPEDSKVFLIDLGKFAANALAASGYWSSLHPNLRAHAVFASKILSKIKIAIP